VHAAVETLGHLLALHVTPASEQDREQMGELAQAIQEETGESVELAYVEQGYSGERPALEAGAHGIRLAMVKHPESKHGFSCYYHAAGWLNAISHGHRGFGA